MKPIYLDNHSTTPLDGRVLEAMEPYLREDFGNAASRTHVFGWRAEAAVELARAQVASLIGCSDKELVFTSGATESNNLAIKGACELAGQKGDHIVTVKTEHRAVLDVCRRLERARANQIEQLQRLRLGDLAQQEITPENERLLWQKLNLDQDRVLQRWIQSLKSGARATYLDVGADGRIDLQHLRDAITDKTFLVSVMLANNEIGTLQPVAEVGELCRERGVLFHCDAVQGVGKIPFDVEHSGADLVSLSAHKIYGPKGVGALFVRRKPRVRIAPLIDGGGHEWGMRSGTLNVAGIVGFGKAAELARTEMPTEALRILALREKLRAALFRELSDITLNGSLQHRLPGNLNVSFRYLEADMLIRALKDVAVSSGSACTSASLEPSYVLRACGVPEELAQISIRFGIGRFNTEEEIDTVGARVVQRVNELREASPLYRLARASGAGGESMHRQA